LAVNYTLDNAFMTSLTKLPKHQREAALHEVGKIEWDRCAEDVLYWLDVHNHPAMPYVYTWDPHMYYTCSICSDKNTYAADFRRVHAKVVHDQDLLGEKAARAMFAEVPTIRPFPLYDYMLPLIDAWLNSQFFLMEKSRDMVATWTIVMLYTWDMLFHEGRQHIFQSEDSTKTAELVQRSWIIYNNQPKFLKRVKPAWRAQTISKAGCVKVPELNSEIIGFPQGADQIRQYHPSGIFLDEAAYLVDAGNTFAAVKPAIQDGGRFTAVSSANASWFWKACSDELDTL
jgi:hypothetical protein